MLRRLSTVLSVLSLLLCAATVVLWVRSNGVASSFGYYHAPRGSGGLHRYYFVTSSAGGLSLTKSKSL